MLFDQQMSHKQNSHPRNHIRKQDEFCQHVAPKITPLTHTYAPLAPYMYETASQPWANITNRVTRIKGLTGLTLSRSVRPLTPTTERLATIALSLTF
jgi:hypothetical protein